jgi:hypothetical protein
MFKKLNISLSELDIEKIQGISEYSTLTFKEFSIADKKYLYEILSSKIRFAMPPDVINVTEIKYPGVNPHTDSWFTSINFYLDTTGDETFFWKEIVETKSLKPGLAPFTDLSNLTKTGSFIAQQGDCYLMDVNTIHSISMQVPNSVRKILRLGWYKYSFNQLQHIFKILHG